MASKHEDVVHHPSPLCLSLFLSFFLPLYFLFLTGFCHETVYGQQSDREAAETAQVSRSPSLDRIDRRIRSAGGYCYSVLLVDC